MKEKQTFKVHTFAGLESFSWEYEILDRFCNNIYFFIQLFTPHELRKAIQPILRECAALKCNYTECLDIIYYLVLEY